MFVFTILFIMFYILNNRVFFFFFVRIKKPEKLKVLGELISYKLKNLLNIFSLERYKKLNIPSYKIFN